MPAAVEGKKKNTLGSLQLHKPARFNHPLIAIQNKTARSWSAIISRSRNDFKRGLFNFIAAMPAIGNLDNRIANAHQLLTQDVERFCNSVVNQYSNLSKLFLDIVLYIVKLTNAQAI
ncbi:ATP-binding cassette sub-family D member 3-like isoform X2 [Spea bombifrons]|uniref:ATP-binding cassette sub-family D member 3-like n=1 Tax=Spea bombifrons TaxID=233779 RepID=UPI00234BBD04|nr:ATP-binding cassette sub-family D member 3-like [Spea bombifrons]XP_053325886.1 ATP-binding cassette sub-family D member 3-like isoform X2 [Spea bombifrons]XP_053325888.1 ATP-binding cassette sub-family D member 3-like [Spea bombifrons]XP_053325893.1 ATP-binding cassette sub-family D member 3-like isoform X2 [Spea bombifrons]